MKKKNYNVWLREQLKLTKTRVRKWEDWDPQKTYQAFYDSRQVTIPTPVCDWSFLVALHEIGHISTGPRLFSHLSEYNAEQWAINRASKSYNVVSEDYNNDAKNYVQNHLLTDLIYYGYDINKIKPYVLEWLGLSQDQLIRTITQMLKESKDSTNLNKETNKVLQCHKKNLQSKYSSNLTV